MLNLLQTPFAGHTQVWGDNYASSLVTINQPLSVSVSKSSGEVYFVDYGHGRLRKVSTSKIVTTVASISGLFSVHVSDVNSDVFVTTASHNLKVDPSTGQTTVIAGSSSSKGDSADGTLAVNSLVNFPKSIHATSTGLYFTDSGNHKVKLIGTDGKLSTVAGNGRKGYSGDGGKAVSASLNNPFGLVVNSGGVFIADAGNSVIRKVLTSDGSISTTVNQTTSSITLGYPAGLVYKGTALYISDSSRNNIFKFETSTSTLYTFAGTSYGSTGDGTTA